MTLATITPAPPIETEESPEAADNSPLAWTIWICLQLAHRIAIIAFLSLIAAWFLMFKAAGFQWPLVVAAGASDGAIFFAGVAIAFSRHRPASRSEGRGLIIFNGIIFAIVLYTMLFSRLTYFRVKLLPLTSAPPQVEMPK